MQLSNIVFPNFMALFRFDDTVTFHFLSRMACSKVYACNYLHPPAFRLNKRLPGAIYTLGLSILYTPVLPISPLIGAVALAVQYAVDQYIALRHSSKPRSFQVRCAGGHAGDHPTLPRTVSRQRPELLLLPPSLASQLVPRWPSNWFTRQWSSFILTSCIHTCHHSCHMVL